MGIFGFLSKAHLEQNLASDTLIQRITILEDKIASEKMSIERQTLIINRAEKSISRDTGTADGDIEVQQSIIADANEKLKTLLTVETNTVKDLNDRLKVLDKNVSDVLTSNKSFFNEEKAAADLKASQKEEREQIAIKVAEAQDRIAELKKDHKVEIAKAQEIIANMRTGSQDNKGQFNKEIEIAEQKIFDSQGRIDLFIVEKQPLEKEMLTLEAEIGPVKYIAALAVDWGITDQVETSKAVRWVILLLIVVFDPLAVLLLIAANQSLMRRFPPEPPKPQEIVDLEKPDEEDITLKWNEMFNKQDAVQRMDQATQQLQEWKDKLDKFNSKVPKPDAEAPVEIIQEDNTIPHIDLKSQKKTEDKEIVADNLKDGYDPDEVEGYFEFNKKYEEPKEEQLERFKQREKAEKEALEEVARKAREEETTATVEEALKMAESESVQTPIEEPTIAEQIEEVMETERTRPDFTEVLEPEVAVEQPAVEGKGMLGTVVVKDKKVVKPNNLQEIIETKKYVQNEEQNEQTRWKNVSEKKLSTEEEYHQKVEARIDSLITKIENKEIQITDLSDEDRKAVEDILQERNG